MDDTERADPDGIAVVEAALLLEAGARKDFDKIVVVTCGYEQRVQRYALRLGISPDAARAEVARRAAAQMSDEEKARRADYVIDNSGSVEELERQVEKVWGELKRAASS
jgi:dephospho-CoA kinase